MSDDAVKPDHNALGKAAFIIGLIGLVLSFIPFIGLVSWLLAPLAILFGLIALLRPSRSLAIAGIVTGAITLFICFAWINAAKSVGEAMKADTFNTEGKTADQASAPLMNATVKGLWQDLEDNKVAAGKKYGGHRLMFSNEVIKGFSGDAANPVIQFVGKSDQYISQLVAVSFSAADGEKVAALKKGQKISFLCEEIGESFGGGYSLAKCVLK